MFKSVSSSKSLGQYQLYLAQMIFEEGILCSNGGFYVQMDDHACPFPTWGNRKIVKCYGQFFKIVFLNAEFNQILTNASVDKIVFRITNM